MSCNQYIESIDKDKCMDCGSSNIKIKVNDEGKNLKECKICGKAYYN